MPVLVVESGRLLLWSFGVHLINAGRATGGRQNAIGSLLSRCAGKKTWPSSLVLVIPDVSCV